MWSLLLALVVSHVTFVGCERVSLDQALVQGLAQSQPAGDFEVRCVAADLVEVARTASGSVGLSREVELPPGTAAMRARTVAFVMGELAVGRVPVVRPRRPAVGAEAEPTVDAGVDLAVGAVPEQAPPALAETVDAGIATQVIEIPDKSAPSSGVRPPLLAASVRTNPVELAFLPFFGINAYYRVPARNYLAIGLLAHQSTWLDGVALAPVSFVEEEVRGVQFAALVGRTQHDLTGAQLSFGVNWTSGHLRGVQIGTTSFAGPLDGAQLGLLNIAGDTTGAQVGVVNIARSVTGVQVGLINVARSSVAPIGLLNFVDDTPWRFAVQVSESSLFTAEMKMGGRVLYSVLSAGWTPRATFRLGGGLGARLGNGLGWYAEVQALAVVLFDTRRPSSWTNQLAVLVQFNVGYQLADRLAIFAGTGGQVLLTPADSPGSQYALFSFSISPTVTLVPMVVLGVQF